VQLVSSYKQALVSARRFQRVGLARDSVAFGQLRRYFHWFYFEELASFAPSKFIGYGGTNVENYASAGTGTETTRVLGKFFSKVQRPSQQFDSLAEQLAEWLNDLGASLSRKTFEGTGGIYVRRSGESLSSLEFAGEVQDAALGEFYEGNPVQVWQTRFERDPKARKACLDHYGYACQVCSTDFEARYGPIGRAFIHVHHIEPLASLGSKRRVDPVTDLVPICPNCHAMIHKLPFPQSVAALRALLC
jgi:5-methylcytosine-specific restriction enzyme A